MSPYTSSKAMNPSVQMQVQELISLVSIVVKMIKENYPDTTSICSKNSMNLGEFKARVNLTQKDIDLIKKDEAVTNELIKLDLCERAIKGDK